MSQYKLAIFDWNGTLLDDLPVVYESVVEIFRVYGLPAPTLEEYRNEIEADFMKFYHAHGIPKEVTGNDLNKIRKAYLTIRGHRAQLRSGVKELLLLCRELKMPPVIVSAEKEDILLERLRQFKIISLFDEIHGNSWKKEEVLLNVLDHFGVPAEQAFYLDDSVDGLQAAKNLGITAIGITSGYYPEKRIQSVSPDYTADNLQKVMDIIAS